MKTKRILPLSTPIVPVLLVAITLFGFSLGLATSAEARITKVVIVCTSSNVQSQSPTYCPGQSPTFGGNSVPGVGTYEKIVGIAYGELNPHDPKNAVIVDIEFAPRLPDGNVGYSFNFYILKPTDLSKGAHKVMYEPPNRGSKTWTTLNLSPLSASPSTATADPGSMNATTLANVFLLQLGYTMVWSGWDQSAGTSTKNYNSWIAGSTYGVADFEAGNPTATGVSTASSGLPIATNPTRHNPTGTITGPAYEYIVQTSATNSYALTYQAATTADIFPPYVMETPKLTHRVHLDDHPVTVPAADWAYDSTGWNIILQPGAITDGYATCTGSPCVPTFILQDIYEFSYTAKNPTVNGLGFAAVRDWNAWLRYEKTDDYCQVNPLYGDITRIYTKTSSQNARFVGDFRHLGFNQAENGKKVFDGMLNWIGGADGIGTNYRFGHPTSTERNRQHHLYIEGVFPFANVMTTDPITGKRDSRYARCEETDTCPLAMEIFSANEYWVKATSLLHTYPKRVEAWDPGFGPPYRHPIGVDLPDSPFARNYFISSHQHGTAATPSLGVCQQLSNPLNSSPVQRALWIALDEWSTKGTPPPPSRVPKFSDGTLVPPSEAGFPTNIPSVYPTPTGFVTYTGLKTTRYRLNYGDDFYETGIATINPPKIRPPYEDNPENGPIYGSYVPKTDSDGNDIAGVRLGDVTVPLATYTGWALRSGVWANDGCEGTGQYIPFAKTPGSADPRPSIAERYPTFQTYDVKVIGALNDMVKNRLLLCPDATAELTRLRTKGVSAGVPSSTTGYTPPATVPLCQ